jgi:hypothetical protein
MNDASEEQSSEEQHRVKSSSPRTRKYQQKTNIGETNINYTEGTTTTTTRSTTAQTPLSKAKVQEKNKSPSRSQKKQERPVSTKTTLTHEPRKSFSWSNEQASTTSEDEETNEQSSSSHEKPEKEKRQRSPSFQSSKPQKQSAEDSKNTGNSGSQSKRSPSSTSHRDPKKKHNRSSSQPIKLKSSDNAKEAAKKSFSFSNEKVSTSEDQVKKTVIQVQEHKKASLDFSQKQGSKKKYKYIVPKKLKQKNIQILENETLEDEIQLPNELHLRILSFLNPYNILIMKNTSKYWNKISTELLENNILVLDSKKQVVKDINKDKLPLLTEENLRRNFAEPTILRLNNTKTSVKTRYLLLYLKENNIGSDGVIYLSNSNFSTLTVWILHGKIPKSKETWYLSKGKFVAPTKLKLDWKELDWKNIGDEGARYLSMGSFPELTKLNLQSNDIGDEGARYLSMGNFSKLTILGLSGNNIGDAGAKSLAVGNLTNLTFLDLNRNNIGSLGKEALRCQYPNTSILF